MAPALAASRELHPEDGLESSEKLLPDHSAENPPSTIREPAAQEGSKKVPRSTLLSLPREIRDEIYRFAVFVEDTGLWVHWQTIPRPCALSKVNRQLHHEVPPVYYSQTIEFSINQNDLEMAEKFLNSLDKSLVNSMRHFVIEIWDYERIIGVLANATFEVDLLGLRDCPPPCIRFLRPSSGTSRERTLDLAVEDAERIFPPLQEKRREQDLKVSDIMKAFRELTNAERPAPHKRFTPATELSS